MVDGTPDRPVFVGGGTTPIVLPNAMEGDEYNQTISIFDADGDALSLSLNSGSPPTNFAIVGSNVTFTPPIGSAGLGASQTYSFDLNAFRREPTFFFRPIFPTHGFGEKRASLHRGGRQSACNGRNITISEDCNRSTTPSWYSFLPSLIYGDPDNHQVALNATVLPADGI